MRQFILLTALLLAGCSQERQPHTEDLRTYDVAESAPDRMVPPPPMAPTTSRNASASADQAPNISVTAAPGVAFNYRYAFRLPNARIGKALGDSFRALHRIQWSAPWRASSRDVGHA